MTIYLSHAFQQIGSINRSVSALFTITSEVFNSLVIFGCHYCTNLILWAAKILPTAVANIERILRFGYTSHAKEKILCYVAKAMQVECAC